MSSDRRVELLFVGRPVPEKGLADAIAALRRLEHRPWHLTIVGELPPDADLAGLTGLVTLLGCVRNREIAAIMAARDVLLIPSHYETFGNVALEGLACGMIVIASYTGGLKSLVTDGENGFHILPKDADGLTRKLQFVIEHLGELSGIRRNARASALRYSWDEVVRQTAALLARYA